VLVAPSHFVVSSLIGLHIGIAPSCSLTVLLAEFKSLREGVSPQTGDRCVVMEDFARACFQTLAVALRPLATGSVR